MKWITIAVAMTVAAPAVAAKKDERRIHRAMDAALGHYLSIASALAASRAAGIAEHAKALDQALRRVVGLLPRQRRRKRRRRGRKRRARPARSPAAAPPPVAYYTKRPRATMDRLREEVLAALAVLGKHAGDFRSGDLSGVRRRFFALSRPLIRYVGYFRAKEGRYRTIWCSMEKAAWLQTDARVRNPYSTKMHTCGERVTTRGEPTAGLPSE